MAAPYVPRKDLALNEQFTIIAAGRLGVFAAVLCVAISHIFCLVVNWLVIGVVSE